MPLPVPRVAKLAGAAALDLLFPRQCHGCGAKPEEERFLCWECRADADFIGAPYCSQCGDPVPGHIDHEYLCSFCSRHKPAFDLARSAVRYRGLVGEAIRNIKYGCATWLIPDLVDLLEACMATHYDLLPVDAVCYVPLYPVRERARGFNQAQWLATELVARRKLPRPRPFLRRIKDTGTQTRLTASQRMANVTGVFEVNRSHAIRGQRLLLVDDVMTTGATVNECARVLKRAGAASVHVITVARG